MKSKNKKKKIIPENIGKRYFKVYDAVFLRKVHVILNHTPEEYGKWLTKYKVKDVEKTKFDDFAGFSTEITAENEQTEMVIYQRRFNWSINCQGTLIHEITHTIVKIFAANNIPFTFETQEFFAHMIGRMYEDIAHKLLVFSSKN